VLSPEQCGSFVAGEQRSRGVLKGVAADIQVAVETKNLLTGVSFLTEVRLDWANVELRC
jgi:hypothetical protein